MKKIKLATVFSGIGAVEFALKRLHCDYEIVFACDNGEREIAYNDYELEKVKTLGSIDEKQKYVEELYLKKTRCKNFVKESYLANYDCPSNRYFEDIKLLDGTDFHNEVDLFVGGSPCQSFSIVGDRLGLADARGTLFYEYTRLIKEIQPKVFIYENVRNLQNHDNGKTWKVIKNSFKELNYKIYPAILNASNYGIPQTRRRMFVVGFKNYDGSFEMPPMYKELRYVMKDFTINNCDYGNFIFDDAGEIKIINKGGIVDPSYILSPKIYAYVMKGGTKNFYTKPQINLEIARTLLKTMGNHHRAGIDNYVSFDGTENLGSVRMLTEREVHRLMGFTDDYKIVVSKGQAYKQAGNSIVVDVLMAILKEIFKTNAI